MAGKRILLPCAQIAGNALPEGLIDMGAYVEKLPVYKTVEIEPLPVDLDYIHCIVFTSGSTVRAFVKRFGQVPDHIQCYCLGSPTLDVAQKHGISAELMPKPSE
jgi:uroporphyrinogen III methyltransferase/synthase